MSIEIVGTGHIFEKSVKKVKKKIEEEKPDLVALELDRERFYGLQKRFLYEREEKKKSFWSSLGRGGSFPLLAFFLERIQEKLSKLGVKPGSEMLQALESAKKEGSEVVLIDRNVRITLNHLINIPLKEKIKWLGIRKVGRYKELLDNKVENLLNEIMVDKILANLEKDLPQTYNFLVKERDKFMAYNLFQIQRQRPQAKILAIVGLGHKKGLLSYLSKLEKEMIEIDLGEILREKKVSFFQFFSFLLIILLALIILEVGFFLRK